jgi:hypothetical protein
VYAVRSTCLSTCCRYVFIYVSCRVFSLPLCVIVETVGLLRMEISLEMHPARANPLDQSLPGSLSILSTTVVHHCFVNTTTSTVQFSSSGSYSSLNSTIASISTDKSSGRALVPMALRACVPRSFPKTSTIKSEQPLTTLCCS